MAQPEFALEVLALARSRGIHTCIQTSGAFSPAWAEKLAGVCDLIFFDLKDTDPQRHLRNTGVSNGVILQNLRLLDALKARVVVKCILLSGVNDTPQHLAALADLRRELRYLAGMQVFSWHMFGRAKRETLGMPAMVAPITAYARKRSGAGRRPLTAPPQSAEAAQKITQRRRLYET